MLQIYVYLNLNLNSSSALWFAVDLVLLSVLCGVSDVFYTTIDFQFFNFLGLVGSTINEGDGLCCP